MKLRARSATCLSPVHVTEYLQLVIPHNNGVQTNHITIILDIAETVSRINNKEDPMNISETFKAIL